MAVNKKNIMTRYFFVVLIMGLAGIAIIVKGTVSCLPSDNTGKTWPIVL